MTAMQQKTFFILVGVLLMVLVTVAGIAMTSRQTPPATMPAAGQAAGIEGLGGSWSLTNHHGQGVTDRDYSGKFRLMFFGFTYCPDVCPTELKRLTLILEALGDEAAQITPLFVTIDPERDTPQILKEYLARFDERFIGLTGSVKQIEHMEDIYKVYAAKAADESQTEYSMNHSALVYLIGPDDKVLQVFHSKDSPQYITDTIRAALSAPTP